jgi:hypothetical protein
MKDPDFGQDGLLTFWNSLSQDERTQLVQNLEKFHALVGSLKGRGLVATDKSLTEITLLKSDPDVTELKKLFDTIGLKTIKLIDKTVPVKIKAKKKKYLTNTPGL